MSNSNGRFVNTVIGVTSALVVLGITASVGAAFHTSSQLAAICVRLEAMQVGYEKQSIRFEDTKITVESLRLLMGRINDNHSAIRDELVGLQQRLRELEQGDTP